MLFRSGRNWVHDLFLRRGWLVPRRQKLRRRPGSWNLHSTVPAECLEERALLSTITVTTLDDNTTTDGQVTLREAIEAANTHTSVDGSAVGDPAGNDIVFAPGLTGPINLDSGLGEFEISSSLTITGNGAANMTIDAQGHSRVFHVDLGETVSLAGLTITGGMVGSSFGIAGVGGGIVNQGALTISDSIITGNAAGNDGGGICSYAATSLSLINCTISSNTADFGAGIYSAGSGTFSATNCTFSANVGVINGGGLSGDVVNESVVDCTIDGNSAPLGAGIYATGGTWNITSTTLSNNIAFNFGGGIYDQQATLQVINSTISGNTAATGAGLYLAAEFGSYDNVLTNVTISNNRATNGPTSGGGVFIKVSSGLITESPTLQNTIVAGNFGGASGTAAADVAGALVAASSFNLIGDGSNMTGISNGSQGNQVGTSGSPIDALLGALGDNGGLTKTMALLAGSPALDAGSAAIAVDPNTSAPLTTDQRGAPFARNVGLEVDIGAYEAQSVTLVVTSADDTLDAVFDAAHVTLRDALALANANPGADTITFDAAINATPIVLALGALDISETVTITGNGDTNTIIDAQQNSRIFVIGAGAGDVTLSNMTLENANTTAAGRSSAGGAGGAIFSATAGTLTLSGDDLSGNSTTGNQASGGAIFADGPVKIVNSTLSGNSTSGPNAAYGGAIYSAAAVTVLASTLSGNSTSGIHSYGGALFAFGDIQLTNSTVTGNRTTGSGSNAGALWTGSALTATNSTIAQNSASSGQGGGIYQWIFDPHPVVTLKNTIVAQNTDNGTAPDLSIIGTATVTVTHSLIGDNTGTLLTEAPVGSPDGNGNLIGGPVHGLIDPKLGALADHGGPTQTMALLAGSPAIDAGSAADAVDPNTSASLTADQRGFPFPRNVGLDVDIGAYEVPPAALIVTSADDTLDAVYNAAHFTLRDALALANANPGADTITFDPAINATPIVLALGQLDISETVTITGNGAANTIINAQQNSRIFSITSAAGDVTIDSVTLENGKTTAKFASGGAIRDLSTGTLSILNSTVTGNSTLGDNATGGAISDNRGYVAVTNSTISNNSTAGYYGYGGAIGSEFGSVTLTDSTVSGNFTHGYLAGGGAIAAYTLIVTGSTFNANYTYDDYARGGAITALHDVTITNSSFTGNFTEGRHSTGGAVDVIFGDLTVTGSALSGNFTQGRFGDGGAIYDDYGSVTVAQTTLSGNYTTQNDARGGAISSGGTAVTVTDSTLSGNSTSGSRAIGGAIAAAYGVIVTNSTVTGNSTSGSLAHGGAIYTYKGPVTIIDSTIARNHATNAVGGGIYAYDSSATVTLTNSILALNTDNGTAPDLFSASGATVTVTRSLIGDNSGTSLVAAPVGSPDANGNLIGTGLAPIDPLLGTLANNGGPTKTLALLTGSPAAGAGAIVNDIHNVPITVDQRGNTRFAGGVDIGAYQSPTLASIGRSNPAASPTSANSVIFVVTFNEPVQNVAIGDFTVNAGSVGGVSMVSSSIYDVTVNGLNSFNGRLTLGFAPGQTITDAVVLPLVNTTPTGADVNTYVIDHTVMLNYTIRGLSAHLIQNGTTTVIAVNGHGQMVLGILTDPTHVTVAAWNNDVGTITASQISWSDGGVWTQIFTLPTPAPQVTLTNFVNAGNNLTGHLVQNGTNTVGFINGSGNIVLGQWITPTRAVVGAWNNDVATFSAGQIHWSDGGQWNETTLAPLGLTVMDYINSANGGLVHVVQNGTNVVTFINAHGDVVLGNVTSSTQAMVAAWNNDHATFAAGQISWSDGSLWTLTTTAPQRLTVIDYFVRANGGVAHLVANGTFAVAFINAHGDFALGQRNGSTLAVVPAWRNDMATFTTVGITWSDGNFWDQFSNSPAAITIDDYTVNGGVAHVIQNESNTLAFVNARGAMALGVRTSPTQVIVADWNNDVATFSPGKITWSDGAVWILTTTASSHLTVTDYTNFANNMRAHLVVNGTNTLVFINEWGAIALGTRSNSTQVLVPGFNNDLATFSTGRINWSDGAVWNVFVL